MKILLHTCCAPCTIYPVDVLRSAGYDVMGFFYRHNIHPYTECLKREDTLKQYSERIHLNVIYDIGYDMEGFLRRAAFREAHRCEMCYHDRLEKTAKLAKHGKFDCFSTTLLYSKFQKHEVIADMGEAVAKSVGIAFFYRDFRDGWKTGIDTSKALNMYRQQYCGCIYSEKERFFKPSS